MIPAGSLLDTGPLVALLDKDDQNHQRATSLFAEIQAPFVTCEAVLSEACFLIGKASRAAPEWVLQLGQQGFYRIAFDLKSHEASLRSLLKKYRSRPISLADACLIRLAEIQNESRIVTFDSDFQIYRWAKNKRFEILR